MIALYQFTFVYVYISNISPDSEIHKLTQKYIIYIYIIFWIYKIYSNIFINNGTAETVFHARSALESWILTIKFPFWDCSIFTPAQVSSLY